MSANAGSNTNTGFQKVIADVVDSYYPIMKMTVIFNGTSITNGVTLKPSMAAEAPTVEFQGKPRSLYTLVYFLSLIC